MGHLRINYRALNVPKKIVNTTAPNSMRRLLDIGTRAAKSSYLKQRKASGPSAIISSFSDKMKTIGGGRVIGVIQAGGPQAPYAVWVNFGHTLRNGQWWEGYDFMGQGGSAPPGADTAVKANAERVIKEEIRKTRML